MFILFSSPKRSNIINKAINYQLKIFINNTFILISGSGHTIYNTEQKYLFLMLQHNMSSKDTHTGSIVAQRGAVESSQDW